ncbi:tetratricopeptide repeat protein [Rhodosalinus sp.]|uniref:tetratricopeptide repeat protein n=1 Tax=Rhodosalinus sp. TaxID=2047741 RepID=UPI0039796B0F
MPADLTPGLRAAALALVLSLGAAGAAAQEPSESDLQALRFYLEQDNEEAVTSELRRLQRAFPDWTPPEDLEDLSGPAGPDSIDRIYALIADGDYEGARQLIDETDRAFPDWSPPADMLTLLSVSEAQSEFDAAVAADRAETAIGIARGVPALLSCERANNAWELARMHLSLGETDRALSIYRSVLRTCTAPDILVATLEKAEAVATLSELAEFSDIAQAQAPEATARLRRTEDRLRAGRQAEPRWGNGERRIDLDGEATEAQRPTAGGTGPETSLRPVDRPDTLTRRPASARRTPAPETTAATGASRAGSGSLTGIEAAAERGDWTQCLALSAGSSNIRVIYQRGWCAYNADRPMEAVAAFRQAVERAPSAEVRTDASFGLLLAMLQLDMTEQAARVAASAPLRQAQRIEIEGQILNQRGVRAYQRRDFARAIAFFEEHERLTGVTRRDLALLKGYALLNLGERSAAREIFLDLHSQLATPETRRALSVP